MGTRKGNRGNNTRNKNTRRKKPQKDFWEDGGGRRREKRPQKSRAVKSAIQTSIDEFEDEDLW